jgi:hypothetical protein
LPNPLSFAWSTASGPGQALFSNPYAPVSYASFPEPGLYRLRLETTDGSSSAFADVVVNAGKLVDLNDDPHRALWLKLDESSGTAVADSSGYGLHGTLSGPVDWRPTGGRRGGALAFDGIANVVTVPDDQSLDGVGAFTLAFWFNARAYPADSAGLVSKRDGPSAQNAYTTYLKAADKLLYVDIQGSDNRFASASQIQTGLWYHVAVVFDGSLPAGVRASLYLNGTLDMVANESSSTVQNYTSHLRVGNTHSGAPYWFDGLMDDVRFFRWALSPAEVLALGVTNLAPSIITAPAPSLISGVPGQFIAQASDDGNGGPLRTTWFQADGAPALISNTNSPSTTVTFPKAGSYLLRFEAGDSQAQVAQSVHVLVGSNTNVFDDWVALHFPGVADEKIIAPGSDPDGDGAINFVEFGLGMHPAVADSRPFDIGTAGLPRPAVRALNGTNYLFMEVRRPLQRLGLEYAAVATSDLDLFPSNWTPAISLGQSEQVQNGMETILFRDTLPVAQETSRFMRLQLRRTWP